ncbi:MAG TPA: hypothetical protein VLU43_00805 [Anaeromyxobacteraceae bacterium]|nr:hypothetical protein [Anaeromyxobacteraceae bacterium]
MRAVAAAALLAACAGARPAPEPPTADARLVAALRSKVALDPPALDGDPYQAWRGRAPPAAPAGTVCGVRFEPDGTRYRLATFGDEAASRAAGFAVTHTGACGTCSTLQDLAVYLERPDLTAPVRRCGIDLSDSGSLACIEALGFSGPCARTWFFNARNTRRECFGVCVLSWIEAEAPTRPDGRLNACLQCDEDRSGPVFKAVAGRTRRNSGIRSSIPRPEEEVARVVHDYVPGAPAREAP